MANSWLSEIETRTALIGKSVADSLSADATALFHKQSARGMLRSGGTFKMAYDLTLDAARSFYGQIEEFVKSLAVPPQVPLHTSVLETVAAQSELLTQALHGTLRKAADMAGQPALFDRFLQEHQNDLDHARAIFASNLRAYSSQQPATALPSLGLRIALTEEAG